ncbi:MAG: pyridoxal-phosphate dependent enzyme [Acidimicrobiia bacterium]|nr:MAG: pyridoxal-phosphate dependent enzyme [Acidimicrobiia bacterium]
MKHSLGGTADMRAVLDTFPTVQLMEGPTPLQPLVHLGADLGIDLWLKRDDLTPLGLGGDKARKLEYELAQAIQAGADVIVTCGSAQSNHARLTSAAARKLGLDVVLVLSSDEHAQLQGNLLTVHLMGGEIVMADTDDHWDLDREAATVCDRLRGEGRTPHFVPISGTTPHSCLGYVEGALELIEQLDDRNLEPDAIYTPFGTGGIFTAYLLTLRSLGIDTEVVGISVNRPVDECERYLEQWWQALGVLMGSEPDQGRGDYTIDAGYVGSEYGDATSECLDAIVSMASREGILLDPVYSGKVFAGLLGHVAEGRYQQGSTIVMLHSGGVPANFAYHAEIAAHLQAAADG